MHEIQKPRTHWFGLPMNLFWGYIAIAIFMSGDGFEMAFLSKHIIDMGFTPSQSAVVFTVYGLAAALAAWSSGVVAEIITPQKAMRIGFILWVVMHVLFMLFGLGMKNYPLMLLFYGVRGLAYPLFIYSFVMLVVQTVPKQNLSSAMGWFWAMYSIGIGCIGSYLPSFTIPFMGETGTLWFAIAWVLAGGLMAIVMLRKVGKPGSKAGLSKKEKLAELSRAVTILFTNRNILLSCLIRIINTISLFGFAVIMPMLFVGRLGFTMSEWLQIWAVFFFVTIFTNIMWGILGEKIGWLRQIVERQAGNGTTDAAEPAYLPQPAYFLPKNSPHNVSENGDEEEHCPDLQPFGHAKAQTADEQYRHDHRKSKQRKGIDDADQAGEENIAVGEQNRHRAAQFTQ